MARRLAAVFLYASLLVGCGAEDPPLPEDVYEDGWDQTTRSQRIQLLRRDLDEQLEILRNAGPGTERHRDAVEDAARTLSALRSDLTTTERGKEEYRSLESQVDAMTGDAS